MLKVLELKKQGESLYLINYMGMSENEQMYYMSSMISQVCEFEIPKIEREGDSPIILLELDEEKKELKIFSSEDDKETISLLASAILMKLMNV